MDAALDASATGFDSAAYTRMSAALARAALIVVTHEHSEEQVAELKPNLDKGSFAPLHLPSTILDGYEPLDYVRYLALSPGVVLIKSPGHTPGSQMIYVRRVDGVDFLFLGDVAWLMRNVEIQREKGRVATLVAGEDRTEVREELAGLNQLHVAVPEIYMMAGHDAAAIDSFEKNGLLVKGL